MKFVSLLDCVCVLLSMSVVGTVVSEESIEEASGVLVAVWHQHMCFLDCSQRKVELERRAEIWPPGQRGERRMGQEAQERLEPELWRERRAANLRRHSDTGDTQIISHQWNQMK